MGDVLFLAHRVPYPPDRGDKIRGFHMLRHLAGHRRVHLIAFADDPRDLNRRSWLNSPATARSCGEGSRRRGGSAGAGVKRRPVSLTAFDNAAMRRAIAEYPGTRRTIDTIFVFSSQMAQYLPAKPRASA
jgi:hypothetical protein